MNKALFYLTLFLFAFIPLYPKFPLFNIKGTFVAVRIEDFLIALTIGLWISYILINKKLSVVLKDNTNKAILLFFSIGILSLFSALFLTHSITPHIGVLHFLRRVELIFLLPVVVTIFNTKKRLISVLIVLFLTLIVTNLYGLGQQYLDWPVISTTNSEFAKGLILRLTPGARVNSTFAGHYDFAVFLSAAIVFLAALFFALEADIITRPTTGDGGAGAYCGDNVVNKELGEECDGTSDTKKEGALEDCQGLCTGSCACRKIECKVDEDCLPGKKCDEKCHS